MWIYILKRALLIPLTLFGITILSFIIINLAPGDPISLSNQGDEMGMTLDEAMGAQRETYAKDIFSILARYWEWLTRMFSIHWVDTPPMPEGTWSVIGDSGEAPASGAAPPISFLTVRIHEAFDIHVGKFHVSLFNFKRSLKDRRPVLQTMIKHIRVSIFLQVITLMITYIVAIPLGMYCAVKRDSIKERTITVLLFMLYSLPSFWVAYMLILYVGKGSGKLELLPIVGLWSDNFDQLTFWAQIKDYLQHLVLPIVCMTLGSFAYLSRQTRAGMLEVLRQDYITTARAKGLPESIVIGKHALRNSLIPIITLMAGLLPSLIGGSFIIETIFTINGMGRLGFTSVLARDYTTLMAVFTSGALLVLIGLLLTDIMYTIVDPRVSFEKQVG
jgi:peptide/nickel transport system permease protein